MPTPHAGLFRSLLEAADVQHTIVAGQHASAMSAARYAEKVTAPEVSDTEPMTGEPHGRRGVALSPMQTWAIMRPT
jgi:precorrin-4 methylase